MTDEEVAKQFLAHLDQRGEPLLIENGKWLTGGLRLVLTPKDVERILRTYLLHAEIPQTIERVANLTAIIQVMLNPHPLGVVRPDEKSG